MASIPHENDVLLGRGTSTNTHSGNIQFRSIVNGKKSEYLAASKTGKRSIALSIIEKIESMDPPGNFLCEDPAFIGKGGEEEEYEVAWIRADDKKIMNKVTHCLREKKRTQKKKEIDEAKEIKCAHTEQPVPNPPAAPDVDLNISEILKFDEFDDFDDSRVYSNKHDTQIPLREWANCAIHSVDISSVANESYYSSFGTDLTSWPLEVKTSLALSSESYLIPALKIAHSLADQICREEELIASHRDGQKVEGNVPLLPTPGYNWAERIAVNVSSTPNENDIDLGPSPFFPEHVDDEEKILCNITSRSENICYQSVSKAKILPSLTNDDGKGGPGDELQRIYSLGLAFYELFSGGKRPPELLQRLDSNVPNIPKSEQCDALDYKHPTIQADVAIDFAGAMNILYQLNGSSDDKLCEEFNEQHLDNAQRIGKKSRSERTTRSSNQVCLVSIDPLKMQGIPVSLCDLIGNMIDCANGDLRGDESYSKMTDIRSDLQLMIDKPSKFLQNLDIVKLSLTGIKLDDNETLFGRDDEFSELCSSYQRSITCDSQSEFAIISGPSGTGKTVLALKLANFATTNGGIFLPGKFDQLQQTKPFSAIASAFNKYCDLLVNGMESSHAINVVSTLRETLGQDARHLVNVIPSLCPILGNVENTKGGNRNEQDCVDAQKRLQYLLCRFVEVISSLSETPVTLFLDDLQWADTASIAVINHLLLTPSSPGKNKRFFFLGCCREDETGQGHPIWSTISSVRHLGVRATIIPLSCMDNDTTNEIVSDLLRLSPRLTRTLSDIVYHKTKGNAYFFARLMLSLNKEGLLHLSPNRCRWEWDEEKIQKREIADDVALFLTGTIGQLPLEVQSALRVLSCFGASTNIALIQALERETGLDLADPLKVAVAEGLLMNIDGQYRFSHDRVQEAAYNMMRPEEQCLFHFQYGLALCNGMINNDDYAMLFTAVDQVNRGGPSRVADVEQGVFIANLNLMAGNKATGMSDFMSAFKFFENGISFLGKNAWKEHYEMTLQLFEKAANCSFAIGELVKVKILSKQVLASAHSFEDTLNIRYITMGILLNDRKFEEAIEKGITVLTKLGEDFSDTSSDSNASFVIKEIKSLLFGLSDDDLLNYRPISDSSKIMAMAFLRRLAIFMLVARPNSLPNITLKMVRISLVNGMSSLSAIGFVYFGSMLVQSGNIRDGYHYATIARNLIARFGRKDVAGEVIVIASQIAAYAEPVQTILDDHLQGCKVALEAGDFINAMFNMILYCALLFWSGAKLAKTRQQLDVCIGLMKQHDRGMGLENILPLSRSVSILIGNEDDASIISETSFTCNSSLAVYYFQNMYTSLIFREYDAMKGFAEKYYEGILETHSLLYVTSVRTFFAGLSSFWIHRRSNIQSNDSIWFERGIQCKSEMRNWAGSSQWNFLNKLHLLEAEEYYCGGKIECAKLSYDNAISCAREHKFINDEALSCELAGLFYLEIGEQYLSVDYFTRAHKKYHEWGALSKANKLFEFVQSNFPNSSLDRDVLCQFDKDASSERKRMHLNL